MPVWIEIVGDAELKRAYEGLGLRVQRRILGPALRRGANLIRDEARATKPFRTGRLKIQVRSRRPKKDKISFRVLAFARKSFFTAAYIAPLEFGHKFRNRFGSKKNTAIQVPPVPFMRRSARRKKDQVIKLIEDRVRYGIAAEAAVGTIQTP